MHVKLTGATRRAFRALTPLVAAMLFVVPWAQSASAHGSTVDPISRNYGCLQRWGDRWQDPAMQQEDPMCWQAWQDNPNAMWNWNGLYQNGLAGQFQQRIPDGQLCSGGLAESGRYRSMDTPGAWKMTDIGTNFSVHLYDQASHGADYFKIYVSRQGYDATRQALRWSDLELVKTTGKYAPSQNYVIDGVSAPGRSGRHVVFTIWQASHMDQAYFLCSDVNFR